MNKLNRFYTRLQEYQDNYPSWRQGQAAYNALYAVAPEVCDEILGTELDPFYVDDDEPGRERLHAFFEHAAKRLTA